MIGSVSEMQADLAALGKCRQDAGRQAGGAITGAHAAGQAAATAARATDRVQVTSVSEQEWAGLTGAERARLEQAGIRWDPGAGVMVDADSGTQVSVGEAQALLDRPAARKGFEERGATAGPATFREPAAPAEPGEFRRPYLREDHAATSPQFEGPRTAPLPPGERGIVTQVQLPAAAVVGGTGPGVASIANFQARVGMPVPMPQPPRGGE